MFNKAIRSKSILDKVLFVNGQPGCGKTLFTSIMPTIPRVELLNFSTEIENICALYHLKKISKDGAESFIKIHLDELIYNTYMSRRVNFRFGDLSSVFRDPYWHNYISRLFKKGDETIPAKIKLEKPILHLATHNILPYSDILFDTLKNKIFFIEIIRHPAYMIKQQIINYENHKSNRQFHLNVSHGTKEIFFWDLPYIKKLKKFKPAEYAIYHLNYQQNEQFKKISIFRKEYRKFFLVIPFEQFVLNPNPYLNKIENLIGSQFSKKLSNLLKREKVPRKKVSDGISSKLYKRCGWEPGDKNLNEDEEIEKRINFVLGKKISYTSFHLFKKSIDTYDNFLIKNNSFL